MGPVARLVLHLALVVSLAGQAGALNKQGARTEGEDGATFNVAGYAFGGVFLYNPSYAARPNNTGNTLLRYGLHVDVDLYHRWLSLSYDLNVFTDRSDGSRSLLAPSEHDHIVGVLSTIPLRRHLELTLAVHYENDQPGLEAGGTYRAIRPDCARRLPAQPPDCYQNGYSQSYVDAYARLGWTHGRYTLAAALGGFLWNTTYAARPDNSGLALLRYVLHGEVEALRWLVLRLDLNFFTDRQDLYVVPTEVDLTAEIGARYKMLELKLVGEVDLPLRNYPGGSNPPTKAGIRQEYIALMLSFAFDLGKLR